jgi:hypothetical protein
VSQASQLDNYDRLRAMSQQLLVAQILSRVVKEEGPGDAGDDKLISRVRSAITISS